MGKGSTRLEAVEAVFAVDWHKGQDQKVDWQLVWGQVVIGMHWTTVNVTPVTWMWKVTLKKR